MMYTGPLILNNNYLCVKSDPGPGTLPVIWPFGYSLSSYDNKFQVLDEKGQPRGLVGDKVRIPGDKISEEQIKYYPDYYADYSSLVGSQGPFFLADDTTNIPYLLVQATDHLEQPEMNSTIEGQLMMTSHIMTSNNYVRLLTGNDLSLLLVWPYGYWLFPVGQEWTIFDAEGQAVAVASYQNRNGDRLSLKGVELTETALKKYTGVSVIPKFWTGPYWLVTEVKKIEEN